ncbi:MAG: hypothetical protein ACOX6T_16520 [Myxococcales bacterium]|jgi:hypothetical protein
MKRSSILSVLLLSAACATSGAPVAPALPAATSAVDASLLGDDAFGLADAGNRLCTYLATQEERRLGFELASRAHALAPQDKQIALTLARCAFFRADWEPEPKVMTEVAQAGMDAAAIAGANEKEPRSSYYFGLNLGLVLQHKGLEALSLLPKEIEALEAASAEPEQDLGGPLRVLGMLYMKAPAWPAGPGDLEKSLELLEEAARRFPSHPLNRLFYAEALAEDDEKQSAAAELEAAMKLARPELWGNYAERWQGQAAALAK